MSLIPAVGRQKQVVDLLSLRPVWSTEQVSGQRYKKKKRKEKKKRKTCLGKKFIFYKSKILHSKAFCL